MSVLCLILSSFFLDVRNSLYKLNVLGSVWIIPFGCRVHGVRRVMGRVRSSLEGCVPSSCPSQFSAVFFYEVV